MCRFHHISWRYRNYGSHLRYDGKPIFGAGQYYSFVIAFPYGCVHQFYNVALLLVPTVSLLPSPMTVVVGLKSCVAIFLHVEEI